MRDTLEQLSQQLHERTVILANRESQEQEFLIHVIDENYDALVAAMLGSYPDRLKDLQNADFLTTRLLYIKTRDIIKDMIKYSMIDSTHNPKIYLTIPAIPQIRLGWMEAIQIPNNGGHSYIRPTTKGLRVYDGLMNASHRPTFFDEMNRVLKLYNNRLPREFQIIANNYQHSNGHSTNGSTNGVKKPEPVKEVA